jgi:hypothetical protein
MSMGSTLLCYTATPPPMFFSVVLRSPSVHAIGMCLLCAAEEVHCTQSSVSIYYVACLCTGAATNSFSGAVILTSAHPQLLPGVEKSRKRQQTSTQAALYGLPWPTEAHSITRCRANPGVTSSLRHQPTGSHQHLRVALHPMPTAPCSLHSPSPRCCGPSCILIIQSSQMRCDH